MAARAQANITDRAKRYRAQNAVTGPRKCVMCGSRSDIQVMHLTGNESDGEKANLAYGCRSCNGKMSAAFKALNLGRPTNQYNPASKGIPTFEQYMWAVSNHSRGAHDAGGAVIHATPKSKRIEYARRIVAKAQRTKKERFEDRWNPTNPWPFSSRQAPVPASGGIAHHTAKRRPVAAAAKAVVTSTGSYKGYVISKTVDGEFFSSLDPQSWFETKAQAQRHIDRYEKGRVNPAKVWLAFAAGQYLGTVTGETKAAALANARAKFSRSVHSSKPITVQRGNENPAGAAAEVFEEFHGYQPSEVVTVTKKIFHHAHLAAAGELVFLKLWGIDEVGHTIKNFKGAILAFNETKNQLFVEGGDQRINLKDYGITKPHELETLGVLVNIGYHTNKTHLGDEGGEAVYVHKLRSTNENGKHVIVRVARYPDAIYDVRNEQILFSGGSYEILREGINK